MLYLVQICLHELKDNVDILELARAGRQHDVLDFNNVCKEQTGRHKNLVAPCRLPLGRSFNSDAHLGAGAIGGA